jgi:hypothetical protein
MERITHLDAPPTVGQFYLVPTVRYIWHGGLRDWAVFLPLHEDARFFEFPHQHYHVDPRFIPVGLWERLELTIRGAWMTCNSHPLSRRSDVSGVNEPHPPIGGL